MKITRQTINTLKKIVTALTFGIYNTGNTCWLNAFMQLLLSNTLLLNLLINNITDDVIREQFKLLKTIQGDGVYLLANFVKIISGSEYGKMGCPVEAFDNLMSFMPPKLVEKYFGVKTKYVHSCGELLGEITSEEINRYVVLNGIKLSAQLNCGCVTYNEKDYCRKCKGKCGFTTTVLHPEKLGKLITVVNDKPENPIDLEDVIVVNDKLYILQSVVYYAHAHYWCVGIRGNNYFKFNDSVVNKVDSFSNKNVRMMLYTSD